MIGYQTSDDLVAAVDRTDAQLRTLGYAPGGRPLVVVETGGERTPAVLVTAGAHATEHAGVCAAVELIDSVETDHQLCIVPTRDPVGLDGFDAALALGYNHTDTTTTVEQARSAVAAAGEIIHEDEWLTVGLIGDYGYAITRDRPCGSGSVLQTLKQYTETQPDVLSQLAGRRVFTTTGANDIDGARPFERTYTLIIDPAGRPMHLNRFFTDQWAPVETRCIRALMAMIEPGLTIDNHETTGHGNRFHVSLRPQRTPEGDHDEADLGRIIVDTVAARGTPIATDADVLDEPTTTVAHATVDERPTDGFFRKSSRGAYWVDPHKTDPPRLGEGLNATDVAADQYGLAFTLETGMYGTLEQRMGDAVAAIQAAIDAF